MDHKGNIAWSVGCAVVAAIINFAMYGVIEAAIFGAGTITFIMSLCIHYGMDAYHARKARKAAE